MALLSCKKEYSCEGCVGTNRPTIAIAGAGTELLYQQIVFCQMEKTPVTLMGR
jgi:hypothetical protein